MYAEIVKKIRNRFIPLLISFILSCFLFSAVTDVLYAANITYTYDNLNRLTKVDYGNGGTITYAYDAAGNRLSLVSTPPDLTPPSTPLITDDGSYTTNLMQLYAVWVSNDPESGVAEYQYAIGTTPLGTDVAGWISTGTNTSVTHTGLSLLDGITYYFSVKARNGIGSWSDVGSSDGIMALSPAGDADGDGLTNNEEINIYGTNPLIADTDGDGMPDGWEVQYNLNPVDPGDATTDLDVDGFTNLHEYQKGTSPTDSLSHPPLADAGRDQNVKTGSLVTLDGSASSGQDGGLITFEWTQTYRPPDSTAALSDPAVPKPSFIADKDGHYSYDLTVCDYQDSNICSGPDSVSVYATVLNVPPNANAGSDQRVLTGQSVLLDGGASNDPDSGPVPLSYLWSFMKIPAGSLRTDQDIAGRSNQQAGFVPDVDGEYQIDVAVSDGSDTTHDGMVITASAATPPVANAGPDQAVKMGQGFTLDGSGSHDQDGLPQPLIYQWGFASIPAGSGLTNSDITNANTSSASFTPDKAGSYVLQLSVSDGETTSTDNTVVIVDSTPQTRFEESDPAIIYTGIWNSLACNPCNNGFLKYSGQTGAKAEFSFYGTGIKWHAAKAPALGKAKIYFDGAYKGMVDLYRSTVQYPLVLGGSGIPAGNHTLTIEVSGQKNAGSSGYYTVIDGFEVAP